MSLSSAALPIVTNSPPELPAAPATPRQREPAAAAGATALHLAMLLALYSLPILAAVRAIADPVIDPDIWWHLRAGQWVVEHQSVPATDPFSRPGAEQPWVAYSWLYEVLIFRLYEAFGLAGIVVYRAGMSLAIVTALHHFVRRREPRFLVALALTAAATLAMAPLFSERPWLFTILFTTLTLDAILTVRAGQNSWRVWLLPLLFVLWANLHIQFVYGLFLLGLACAAPVIDAFLARRSGKIRGPLLSWRMVLLSGLCLLATFANPYRGELYRVVWECATQSGPYRCINEMRALEFRETSDWVMLALAAAAAFTLGRQRRWSSFEFLLLAAAGFFAFRSRRELWFLALASTAILARGQGLRAAARARKDASLLSRSPTLSWPQRVGIISILAALIGLVAWQRGLSEENMRRKIGGVFPVEAAAVIAERGYAGPLYNDFNWGGYLIWSLPQLPVVLDGRANLHGDERILRIGNTWAAGPGWREDPDLTAAGVILADVRNPLAGMLCFDERFQLVHEDPIARVFVRRRSGSPTR